MAVLDLDNPQKPVLDLDAGPSVKPKAVLDLDAKPVQSTKGPGGLWDYLTTSDPKRQGILSQNLSEAEDVFYKMLPHTAGDLAGLALLTNPATASVMQGLQLKELLTPEGVEPGDKPSTLGTLAKAGEQFAPVRRIAKNISENRWDLAASDIAGTALGYKGFHKATGFMGLHPPTPADTQLFHPAVLNRAENRLSEFAYGTPLLRNVAALLSMDAPKTLANAWRMVEELHNTRNKLNTEALRFATDMSEAVPAAERTVDRMGAVIQGTKTPEEAQLSPKAMEWVKKLADWQHAHDELLRQVYGDDITLQDADRYLAQIFDLGKLKPEGRLHVAKVLLRDKFLQGKKYASYAEAEELAGLKPLYDDVAKIMFERSRVANQALTMRHFANQLRASGFIADPGKAPVSWPKLAAGALEKAVYAGKSAKGDTILRREPVSVHPKVYQAVNAVFGKRMFAGDFGEMSGLEKALFPLEVIRALSKQMKLSWTFFHHQALGEQSQALSLPSVAGRTVRALAGKGAFPTVKEVSKSVMGPAGFLVDPEYYKGLASGLWRVAGKEPGKWGKIPLLRMDPDMVNDAMAHGLEPHSHGDSEKLIIQKLNSMGIIGKKLGGVASAWDRGLWDFYMQGQMLESYHMLVGNTLRRMPDANADQIAAAKRAVATHVNDAYGAINFERLLQSPQAVMFLNWMMLAPAWTISNLRIPARIFERGTGGTLARKWAVGAAVSWFVTTQLANYAATKYWNMADKNGHRPNDTDPATGKPYGGHFSWDNAGSPMKVYGHFVPGLTDNAFNIAVGYNDDGPKGKPGTQSYAMFGKGFREPVNWLLTPFTMASRKMSIPAKEMLRMGTILNNNKLSESAKGIQLAQEFGSMFVPIVASDTYQDIRHAISPKETWPVKGSSQRWGQPTHRGYTETQAITDLKEAWQAGDSKRALQIIQSAHANSLNLQTITQGAKAARSKEYNQEHDIQRHPSVLGQPTSQMLKDTPPEVRAATISLLGLAALASTERLADPKFKETVLANVAEVLNRLPVDLQRRDNYGHEQFIALWKSPEAPAYIKGLRAAYDTVPEVKALLDGARLHIHTGAGMPGTPLIAEASRAVINESAAMEQMAKLDFEKKSVELAKHYGNNFIGKPFAINAPIEMGTGEVKSQHTWDDFHNAAKALVTAIRTAEPESHKLYRGIGIDLNNLKWPEFAKMIVEAKPGDILPMDRLQAFSDAKRFPEDMSEGSGTGHNPDKGSYRILFETVGPVKRLNIAALSGYPEQEALTFGRWEVVDVRDMRKRTDPAGYKKSQMLPLLKEANPAIPTRYRRITIRQLDTFDKPFEVSRRGPRGKSYEGSLPKGPGLYQQLQQKGVKLPPGWRWEVKKHKIVLHGPQGQQAHTTVLFDAEQLAEDAWTTGKGFGLEKKGPHVDWSDVEMTPAAPSMTNIVPESETAMHTIAKAAKAHKWSTAAQILVNMGQLTYSNSEWHLKDYVGYNHETSNEAAQFWWDHADKDPHGVPYPEGPEEFEGGHHPQVPYEGDKPSVVAAPGGGFIISTTGEWFESAAKAAKVVKEMLAGTYEGPDETQDIIKHIATGKATKKPTKATIKLSDLAKKVILPGGWNWEAFQDPHYAYLMAPDGHVHGVYLHLADALKGAVQIGGILK